jgi:hypothetical protein
MNRSHIVLSALLLCLFMPVVSPAKDEAGLGIIIGTPTGISGKLWNGSRRAMDAAIGWSMGDYESFYFHADYLFQDPKLFVVSEGTMPFYFGIGGRLRQDHHRDVGNDSHDNDTRLGVRMPLGLEYLFRDVPLNMFIEIALVLDLTPRTEADIDAGIGVRYRFNTGGSARHQK